MRILGITDIHGRIEFLKIISDELKEADLILVSGDITHFGGKEEALSVIKDIRNLNKKVFVVPGNCDYPEAQSFLTSEGINLHGKCVLYRDYVLAGVGGSLTCPGRTPYEHSEEKFRIYLENIKMEISQHLPLIFVSHQPPVDTVCDLVRNGMHVGSKSIRDFIIDTQPILCLTGHIHEGRGIDSIGNTVVVNPGPLHHEGYVMVALNRGVERLKLMKGRKIISGL